MTTNEGELPWQQKEQEKDQIGVAGENATEKKKKREQ